ncbi:hypothetical protein LguiA_004259 [Lonicera macranthoides]
MAISLTATTVHCFTSDHTTPLSSPSPSSSKLSHFSPLQFSQHLRLFGTSKNKGFSSRSRPRILPLVAAKKQTFSSLDELLANADKPVLEGALNAPQLIQRIETTLNVKQ